VFLIKKFLGDLLMPFPLTLAALIVGLFFVWSGKKRKAGLIIMASAIGVLGIAGMKGASDIAAGSLERRYLPLMYTKDIGQIEWIVVLSAGHNDDTSVPALGRLADATAIRLMEGIRLYRVFQGSRLLLSGGAAGPGEKTIAENMREVAVDLGVPECDIVLDGSSMDTADQAVMLGGALKGKRFILVTSAAHMSRSMALFRRQGVEPIPAPTHYLSLNGKGSFDDLTEWLPDAENLVKMDTALHEYLGMAWALLRGQF
jgi:uncharacterized SAM-binding protein YcdF (DUF218 family)